MIKDKPWTPATLKDMKGLEGIGVRFSKNHWTLPPPTPSTGSTCRPHATCSGALLPHGAADIKGHMRSYDELLEASGYGRQPAEFDRLMAILGTELRLITPTDPGERMKAAGPRKG